jgi:hypothetical protein
LRSISSRPSSTRKNDGGDIRRDVDQTEASVLVVEVDVVLVVGGGLVAHVIFPSLRVLPAS